MTTGLTMDYEPDETDYKLRKSAVIDRELSARCVDIAALQETRLLETGSIREQSYTIYWSGKPSGNPHQHGVGFAVKNTLINNIEGPFAISERLCWLSLALKKCNLSVVCAYAPTLYATPEDKDLFYNQLSDLLSTIPSSNKILLLGDFNARVGHDDALWPDCLGKFGIGRINDNGQRALELCARFQLCVTNTFFKLKDHHKVSWKHPRSNSWHQLDLVLTRRRDINDVRITRAYHSADCDTDHALVLSKLCLKIKKFHSAKKPGQKRVDVAKTNSTNLATLFVETLSNKLAEKHTDDAEDPDLTWHILRDTIHSAAIGTFGYRSSNCPDWFAANLDILTPAIEEKRKALLALKENPCMRNKAQYRSSCNTVRQLSRSCINRYLQDLCDTIDGASVSGNLRTMYAGIKSIIGPTGRKTAPLKSKDGSTITEKSKQLERWIEHYSELYGQESSFNQETIDSIPNSNILYNLDTEPDVEEISRIIKSLPKGKASGSDAIPAELLKAGHDALIPHLHSLLIKCWRKGTMPQDMRDSNIVTLYKNKGDRGDCNNYRGISLLSVVGKVFARVLLSRLQLIAETVYPESQCGFRSGRGTVDMVFTLRQIQEKSREQQKPLHIAFVDLTKAFDLVNRNALFQVLEKVGCPPRLLKLITSFHSDMMSTIQADGMTSEPFKVISGVKQGCVLAPTLFGIYFSVLLKQALTDIPCLTINTRFDNNLYAAGRLKAKTKISHVELCELLYADDAAFCAQSGADLQAIMDKFAQACSDFGFKISIKKTEIVSTIDIPNNITVHAQDLKNVSDFVYLGSNISANCSLDHEINRRLGKASTTFGRLSKRVFDNKNLTIKTKVRVYEACVLSILLYGAESWTTYRRQELKLNSFHMRCLRNILGLRWQDKVRYAVILDRCHAKPLTSILKHRRLRWLGHVYRMTDQRLPKVALYGELSEGSRKRGRPLLRWKDVAKRDLINFDINHKNFENNCQDRPLWRKMIYSGLDRDHKSYLAHLEQKSLKRSEKRKLK